MFLIGHGTVRLKCLSRNKCGNSGRSGTGGPSRHSGESWKPAFCRLPVPGAFTGPLTGVRLCDVVEQIGKVILKRTLM